MDLKDGFHHVSVNPEFRTFLGFCWKNQFYVWNVLPFRLRSSPWFFNKLIRCVVQYLRSQNLKLSFWVDDCLLMGKPEDIDHVKSKLLGTLDQLLLCINWEKSSLEPSYTKEYIGYIVNSSGPDGCPCIKIPNRRVNKLKRDICRALRAGFIKARFLARICGQIISFSKAIIRSKLLVRNLYRLLRSRTCWDSVLHLDEACTSDMKWWLSAFKSWNGCSVLQHSTDIQITTDASATGWGAICGRHEASGLWNVNQIYEHSNYRELMTVLLALISFKPYIEGKTIQLLSDNIVTVAYINHLGGPCPKLTELAKAIYAEAFALRISLQAEHLAGCLNTIADPLSRLSPQSTYSWSIHPAVFLHLDQIWGPHSIDRFADITNHVRPQYNSLYHDPLTAGVDALAQTDWAGHNNFVNPRSACSISYSKL